MVSGEGVGDDEVTVEMRRVRGGVETGREIATRGHEGLLLLLLLIMMEIVLVGETGGGRGDGMVIVEAWWTEGEGGSGGMGDGGGRGLQFLVIKHAREDRVGCRGWGGEAVCDRGGPIGRVATRPTRPCRLFSTRTMQREWPAEIKALRHHPRKALRVAHHARRFRMTRKIVI